MDRPLSAPTGTFDEELVQNTIFGTRSHEENEPLYSVTQIIPNEHEKREGGMNDYGTVVQKYTGIK